LRKAINDQRCDAKARARGTDHRPSARHPHDAGQRRASGSTKEKQADEETINAAACLRLEKIDRATAERLIAGNPNIEQDLTRSS
jgi:hypothetical protein